MDEFRAEGRGSKDDESAIGDYDRTGGVELVDPCGTVYSTECPNANADQPRRDQRLPTAWL